jgi:hypothetical protein
MLQIIFSRTGLIELFGSELTIEMKTAGEFIHSLDRQPSVIETE